MIVSFALTEADFADGFRLPPVFLPSGFKPFVFVPSVLEPSVLEEDGLRGLPDWAEFADFAGRAPGLFLSPLDDLGVSRPPGVCAKAVCEKLKMKKMEETKRIEDRRSKIEDRAALLDLLSSILDPRSSPLNPWPSNLYLASRAQRNPVLS
jgi:hypothetical protein